MREVEDSVANIFEAEFPLVAGRTVEILSVGEAPDRIALIAGIETGVELTSIKAGSAGDIIAEIVRLGSRKSDSYARRDIFDSRPLILLCHLDCPPKDEEGLALYDIQEELSELIVSHVFEGFGFSEIWLMDSGCKYTSRRDPRMPADYFCFAPTAMIGFRERERKRRPTGVFSGIFSRSCRMQVVYRDLPC